MEAKTMIVLILAAVIVGGFIYLQIKDRKKKK